MRAMSASTVISDPYRAGMALGESIAALDPEVVFLFSSIHYSLPDLLEGLHDGLGSDRVIVLGNSGDGCFSACGVSDYGASALALNSAGEVRWRLERVSPLHGDPAGKLSELFARLADEGDEPCWAYLVSDCRSDVGRLEAALQERIGFPVVGGLSMDDRRGGTGFIYVNREVITDALVVLAAYGDLRFSIAVGSAQRAVGHAGQIESADANEIHRIDGISAVAFVEAQTGKPVLQSDRGVLAVRIVTPGAPDEARLRSVKLEQAASPGSLGFFGEVKVGESLQVCQAQRELMLAEVEDIAGTLRSGKRTPAGALLISCTGRKAFLGSLIDGEISALKRAFAAGLPLGGFPSRGEIAPRQRANGYTRNLFHNMTYVVVMFWQ